MSANGTVNLLSGATGATVTGNGEMVTLDSAASANLVGGSDAVDLNGNDYVGLIGGDGYIVTDSGSGSTIRTAVNTNFTISASGNTTYANVGDQENIANTGGATDEVYLAGNAYVGLLGGNGYDVTGQGSGSVISVLSHSADSQWSRGVRIWRYGTDSMRDRECV